MIECNNDMPTEHVIPLEEAVSSRYLSIVTLFKPLLLESKLHLCYTLPANGKIFFYFSNNIFPWDIFPLEVHKHHKILEKNYCNLTSNLFFSPKTVMHEFHYPIICFNEAILILDTSQKSRNKMNF